MIRGTLWKRYIEEVCVLVENQDPEDSLLKKLGTDRRLELAKRVFDNFPEYAESHPVLSERFNRIYENFEFRSSIEYISREQVLQIMQEYQLQL